MQNSKPQSNKTKITPPPGEFAVFSNGSVAAHVFQWQQSGEQVVLSIAPGEHAVVTEDFTSSTHSTLKVLAGTLTVVLEGKETSVQTGESISLEMPDVLHLKTDVFTQGMLSDAGMSADKLATSGRAAGKTVSSDSSSSAAKPEVTYWVGAPASGTRVPSRKT